MKKILDGKMALLTGAAGYFGRYFSRAFLQAGSGLLMMDRDKEKLFSLREDLKKEFSNSSITCVAMDFYDHAQSERALKSVMPCCKERGFDILVNNAFDFSEKTGFNTPDGRLENSTFGQFQSCLESGIYWAEWLTKKIGFEMKRRGKGSIINICSMYAVVVPSPNLYDGTKLFNPPGYSMAKAGLLQFTKYSASFLSPEVRVNAISPGYIPNFESLTNNPGDKTVHIRLLEKILLKRQGHPNDLTGALIFLASDLSGYITGQNIIIDGGLTIT